MSDSRPIPTPELPDDVRGGCSPPSSCSAVWAYEIFAECMSVGSGYGMRTVDDVLECVKHTMNTREKHVQPIERVVITRQPNS
jgi:hypothetical protein